MRAMRGPFTLSSLFGGEYTAEACDEILHSRKKRVLFLACQFWPGCG